MLVCSCGADANAILRVRNVGAWDEGWFERLGGGTLGSGGGEEREDDGTREGMVRREGVFARVECMQIGSWEGLRGGAGTAYT